MTDRLERLHRAGVLDLIDVHFARTVARLAGDTDEGLVLGAALASRQRNAGHICVDLRVWAGAPVRGELGEPVEGLTWPALETWREALEASPAVGSGQELVSSATPLVLDAVGRLYLRRLWQDQQQLAQRLQARATAPLPAVDGARLGETLDRLFGAESRAADHPAHGQRRAALLAVLRPLCVITGGPGTGKTSTVVRLLALRITLALGGGEPTPVIRLLAPTGKAAARMIEAVRQQSARLHLAPEVQEALPAQASTIHRALKTLGGSTVRFRHHAGNPLLVDLVVVDEASMVDLSLMARLVDALPPRADLVLLGDRDQLTSVEAGALLGDLCGDTVLSAPTYCAPVVRAAADLTGDRLPALEPPATTPGMRDAIAPLTHSFRFDPGQGIGALADAIRAGNADAALRVLGDEARPAARLVLPAAGPDGGGRPDETRARILGLAAEGYASYREAAALSPMKRLARLDRFRVLCAHRQGPLGADDLNPALEQRLHPGHEAGALGRRFYAGRPVLITQNHYGLELFNGDVGLLSPLHEGGELRACFLRADGTLRTLAPARLPAHETVFAMSVHKAQGSEFHEVLVVLPLRPSPVLTRELLYTAVTRARSRVTVVARPEIVRHAIEHRVSRASGLAELLWG